MKLPVRRFGATGRDVPIIGEGTWEMESDDRSGAIAAIQRALDLGATHVDTAEMYGSGRVEEIVGEAIAGRRDEVFLVSKVLPSNASKRGTIAACEKSLRRLRTDRLDCYLLHWPGNHPLAETFAAFEELMKEGKILSYGVSNFDVKELEEALAITGEGKIACNQVLYHLKERGIEHRVLPWCEAHGITVVAYSPYGSGDFPGPRSKGYEVLRRIADARGMTERQVALEFLLRRPVVITIPKSSDPKHVDENVGAARHTLERSEIAQLEAAFPLGRSKALPTL
jgi:diketogulonate reductase-like aldo/keto reductase